MPKKPNQKRKLLALRDIMMKYTDENHSLTVNDIIEKLETYDISAERKSVYDDLEQLSLHGYDICCDKEGNVNCYFMGSRDFELAELKLLVDAVQSSKFITEKKSAELIGKLESLASEYDATRLHRQVYVSNRVKTPNEKIYYAVDKIHEAISSDKQITFVYYEWALSSGGTERIVKQARKDGELYQVSPWALAWDDENYYLIAFDSASQSVRHYRVDKMEKVTLAQDNRCGKEAFAGFDMASYSKSVFGMFGGEVTEVRISVDNKLVGVIADRFGKNIFVTKESDKRFSFFAKVVLSPQFYAWLFALGDSAKLLSPNFAVAEFQKYIKSVSEVYDI